MISEEEDADSGGEQLLLRDPAVLRNALPRASRSSKRDSLRARASQRGSSSWQDIPLTPTAPLHKPRRPPSHAPLAPGHPAAEAEVCGATREALSTAAILDRVFSYLSAEELGRMCRVSRLWQERVEQDGLWQARFRAEWQQELNPSPGTFKRWYGALRSASLSWQSPILQQECIKHESFAGRVEIKSVGGETYLVAMSSEVAAVWSYGSLQLLHEIRQPCAFALGEGQHDQHGVLRLIGVSIP